jgi:energy-coupling factor transporter ATP-binding protein EcfA2
MDRPISEQPLISLRDFRVKSPEGKVHGPWTFRVQEGESVVLPGTANSGKTQLLLSLLGGLPKASRAGGEALVMGLPPQDKQLAEIRRRSAWIGCPPELFFIAPTLEDEITTTAQRANLTDDEIEDRLARIAGFWLAGSDLKASPLLLRGDNAVRLALATGEFSTPDLWLWDEPARCASPGLISEATERIKQSGATLLMTSASEDASKIPCDRML